MTRPRSSTLVAAALALVAVLLAATAALLDYSGEPHDNKIVVTVRIWGSPIGAAYRESFDAFSRAHPDIEVRTRMVAYSTYFNTLRTDVAGDSADDIFWLSNAYFAAYADDGRLMDIGKTLGPDAASGWEPAVVDQFTRGGVLWGVPQLTDGGIAVYYNADLLAAAGIDPAQLNSLRWSPGDQDAKDTLRPLLARLTVDNDGNTAGTPGFDGGRVRQWAYNAANDAQAIYLPCIGSAGGVFQRGDEFAFDNPGAIEAFRYLVGLINDDHVAPPASVTNGIAAAGNTATKHPDAVRQVLAWMGSSEGNAYLGRDGAAIPTVLKAQPVYFDYWAAKGVDVTPFFSVLDGPRIPAPGGAGFAAGNTALQGYFDEMFLGRGDVAETLRKAQAAANAAAQR